VNQKMVEILSTQKLLSGFPFPLLLNKDQFSPIERLLNRDFDCILYKNTTDDSVIFMS
jgi:hypothetical protein